MGGKNNNKKKDEGDEWRPTLGFTIQNTFFYIIPPPAKNEFGSIFLFFRVCARGAEMRKTETKNKNDVVRRRYKPRVQQRQREGGEKQSVIAIEWEGGETRGYQEIYVGCCCFFRRSAPKTAAFFLSFFFFGTQQENNPSRFYINRNGGGKKIRGETKNIHLPPCPKKGRRRRYAYRIIHRGEKNI